MENPSPGLQALSTYVTSSAALYANSSGHKHWQLNVQFIARN